MNPPGNMGPPSPQHHVPVKSENGKKAATPDGVFQFFLDAFVQYGAGFGAIYGAGAGLLVFVIGAICGAPIGALLGLLGGIFNGLIIGRRAAYLAGKGVAVSKIASMTRWLSPILTVIGGAPIVFINIVRIRELGGESGGFIDTAWFTDLVWLLAVIASCHASMIIARKFAKEYE